ncbi:hypothetical protein [Helicobacter bizzozeronii]|uniref:hypothetical protein n=1 Tax=Helicobacter bizzozeronii TaxID=56877 RepID=UPI000CEF052E|nr:hypothetical protein [Helicobacter bizzozeronii]
MKTKNKKEKNYWPLGILSVLLIGLSLVVALVVVAIKYTPQSDTTYLHQHTYTDSHINTMLQSYHAFLQDYGVKIGNADQQLIPTFPYYLNQNTPLLWLTLEDNRIDLWVQKRQKDMVFPEFSVTLLRPKTPPKALQLNCKQTNQQLTCHLPVFSVPEGRYQFLISVKFKDTTLSLIQPAYARKP